MINSIKTSILISILLFGFSYNSIASSGDLLLNYNDYISYINDMTEVGEITSARINVVASSRTGEWRNFWGRSKKCYKSVTMSSPGFKQRESFEVAKNLNIEIDGTKATVIGFFDAANEVVSELKNSGKLKWGCEADIYGTLLLEGLTKNSNNKFMASHNIFVVDGRAKVLVGSHKVWAEPGVMTEVDAMETLYSSTDWDKIWISLQSDQSNQSTRNF